MIIWPIKYNPDVLLVMSFDLVAHLPGFDDWGRRTTAIHRIIILFHIMFSCDIIISHHIRFKLL